MGITGQLRRLAWAAPVLLVLALAAPASAQAMSTVDESAVRGGASTDALLTTMAGGMAIYGGGAQCSLGFNLRQGTTKYLVTAGRCTMLSSSWYGAGPVYLGPRVASSFPDNDYGLILASNSSISWPSSVHLYPGSQSIASIGVPAPGQTVWASGAGSGLRSGLILAIGVSGGGVPGLFKTNICSTGADTGGPLFSGTVGYGILSSFSGVYPDCVSYFQPLSEVAIAYGLTV